MEENLLNKILIDVQIIQTDIRYIKEKFDSEKEHAEKLSKISTEKFNDHENRIRNIEQIMYKGLGAAIVFSMIISAIISLVVKH